MATAPKESHNQPFARSTRNKVSAKTAATAASREVNGSATSTGESMDASRSTHDMGRIYSYGNISPGHAKTEAKGKEKEKTQEKNQFLCGSLRRRCRNLQMLGGHAAFAGVGGNEKLLHEGFKTLEEAQRYVRHHRDHHEGAKQKQKRKEIYETRKRQEREQARRQQEREQARRQQEREEARRQQEREEARMRQERRQQEAQRAWARARAAQLPQNRNARQSEANLSRANVRNHDRKQPRTIIDLTACDTAGAVTLDDVRRAERENVRRRIEARVARDEPKDKQVQSKVTSYFQRSKIQNRIDRDRRELRDAVAAVAADECRDEAMHRNIATANNREEHEYSRLVSAQLLEDEKRRRTSEDGESSSSPQVSWTPESASSKQAVAWPGPRELRTIKDKQPNLVRKGSLFNFSDPSRSPTPQPRVSKPAHKVMAVTDSSEEEADAKAKETNKPDGERAIKTATANVNSVAVAQQPTGAASAAPQVETKRPEPAASMASASVDEGVSSEMAKFGQMLLDGRAGKVPKMLKLKLLKDLEAFRLAYEKYQREVKTYNMTHSILIKAHPVSEHASTQTYGWLSANKPYGRRT